MFIFDSLSACMNRTIILQSETCICFISAGSRLALASVMVKVLDWIIMLALGIFAIYENQKQI